MLHRFGSMALASAVLASGVAMAKPQVFNIDPTHTSVVFKVNHLGFSPVYGQIPGVSGAFKVDDKKPANNSLEVTLKAESITTHVKKRDDHLRTPDFFNVKQYPEIKYKSTKITKLKGNKYKVDGKLTLHGVTQPVSFEITRNRTGKDPRGKTRTGAEGQFTIKRSQFGMNYMQGKNQLSDEVTVMLGVVGVLQEGK